MERRTIFKTTIAASVPIAVGGIVDSLVSPVVAAEKQGDDQPTGLVGIVGCILFVPGNLSPLLAVFVIGPRGVVLSVASGLIIGLAVRNPETGSTNGQSQ
jgi:hypothetical protein